MKVCDLHCDTLMALRDAEQAGKPKDFASCDLMLDLDKMQRGGYLMQCMACFVDLNGGTDPLQVALEEADQLARLLERFPQQLKPLYTAEDVRTLPQDGRIGLLLTVEEGGVCHDSPAVLRELYRRGVRMMTLTWNYPNGLAQPNAMPGYSEEVWPVAPNTTGGLTPRGVEMVQEMERLRMIVDVSHLSDAGFWDVVRHTTRPFAASHSNARACCPHVRNLTDEMLHTMGERGCLIGLNYCGAFLNDTLDRSYTPSRTADMVRHAKHLIDHAGEDCVALGSDFDGIHGELEIAGGADLPKLADALLDGGLTERQVEKMFYQNALRFFGENLA